jgi:hypothetical protein
MTKCRRGIQYLRRERGRDCIPSKGLEVLTCTNPSKTEWRGARLASVTWRWKLYRPHQACPGASSALASGITHARKGGTQPCLKAAPPPERRIQTFTAWIAGMAPRASRNQFKNRSNAVSPAFNGRAIDVAGPIEDDRRTGVPSVCTTCEVIQHDLAGPIHLEYCAVEERVSASVGAHTTFWVHPTVLRSQMMNRVINIWADVI